MLSKDDKISIINQHKRNIQYAKYNLELSIISENATSEPNQESIDSINSQIADLDKKMSALDIEAESL